MRDELSAPLPGASADTKTESDPLERKLRSQIAAPDAMLALFEGDILDGMWSRELRDGGASWVSESFWRILGYEGRPKDEFDTIELLHPEDVAQVVEARRRHCEDPSQPYDHTVRYRRADGGYAWIRSRGKALRDADGEPYLLIGALYDETELVETREARERARAEAIASERRLRQAIEAIPDGFVIYDAEDRLVLCNEQYRRLYPESADAMRPGASFEQILRAGLANGQYPEAEGREESWLAERLDRHRRPHGALEQELPGGRFLKIHEVETEDGDTVGLRVDVTQIKRQSSRLEDYAKALEAARSEIKRQGMLDGLTGLANRRRLDEHLNHLRSALEGSKRHVALLHVDLDRFRQINDTIGHAAGDKVLLEAASILRQVAEPGDLVARIGGDEFMLVRTYGGDEAEIDELAAEIVARMSEPVAFGGRRCRYGASIGVAVAVGAGLDPAQLLIDADIALNRAKSSGRNRSETFHPALLTEEVTKRELADELFQALEEGQILPFYQPQFRAGDHEFVGVEALARWRHPTKGVLAPGAFLKAAEEMNLIAEIDGAVLEHAVRDMARLEARGLYAPKLSVNVTAERLRDPRLLQTIDALPPSNTTLAFELIESIFLDGEDEDLMWRVDQLKERDIEIEIDDFGSGRASILGLTKLGPKRLKIDRQIVMPMDKDPAQRPLVQAIVDIGRSLNVEITAEGVESAEHAEMLAEIGCSTLQGFHFSRPVHFDALEAMLRDETWRMAG